MRSILRCLYLCLLSVTAGLYPAYSAAIIEYEVTDLPDTVPAQDRWEYRYFVSGFTHLPPIKALRFGSTRATLPFLKLQCRRTPTGTCSCSSRIRRCRRAVLSMLSL